MMAPGVFESSPALFAKLIALIQFMLRLGSTASLN